MELIACVVVILVIWNGILTFCIVKRKKKEIEERPVETHSNPAPEKMNLESSSSPPSVEWDTGKTGERYTREVLVSLTGYKRFLSNCYLPKPDGTFTEVDVILLHESGLYVFEVKNYSGWIFGEEGQKQWTQILPANRGLSKSIQFFNPILQNKVHLKWLREYIGEDAPLYSYIVFSDRCELKKITLTSNEHVVLNRRNLIYRVRRNAELKGAVLTEEKIDALYNKLYPLTQVTEEQKAAHVKSVEQKKQHDRKTEEIKTQKGSCPRCGSALVLRTARKGPQAGKQFWGCSNFPQCRFVKQVESTPASIEK